MLRDTGNLGPSCIVALESATTRSLRGASPLGQCRDEGHSTGVPLILRIHGVRVRRGPCENPERHNQAL